MMSCGTRADLDRGVNTQAEHLTESSALHEESRANLEDHPMHVTLVHVHVKPADIEAFIAASRSNHEASVREPGNRRFDVLQNPEDAGHFILYEAYASAEAAAAHKQTAHYARWRDTVAAMMAAPRQGVPMTGLFPRD